jgi:hypothetical protein
MDIKTGGRGYARSFLPLAKTKLSFDAILYTADHLS